jgi:hypothetical protein
MRRRSRASSKVAIARSRKAKTLKAVRHGSSSVGGRDAHQRPRFIMDNADNAGVSHLNNARVFQVAFILLSVACSVSVAGSDIGPKVLAIIIGH